MKLTVLGPGCWGLTIAKLLNNNFDELCGKIYFRIALLRDDLQELDLAIENYQKSINYALKTKDLPVLASSYSNIASIYEEKDDLQNAIEFHKKSLKIDTIDKNFEGTARFVSKAIEIYCN